MSKKEYEKKIKEKSVWYMQRKPQQNTAYKCREGEARMLRVLTNNKVKILGTV